MTDTLTATNLLDALKEQSEILRQLNAPPGAWIGFEFVARYGRNYEPRALPTRFAYRTPKRCFDNAYRLVSKAKGLRYVEGYIALKALYMVPVHHAWAIDSKDRVIDPTIREPLGWEYCGVPIDLVEVALHRRPDGLGVFESGAGMNLEYFHSADPSLGSLLPEAVVEHLRSRYRAKNNRA
jgi:hypothetical protein